jgi:hypothetical protein
MAVVIVQHRDFPACRPELQLGMTELVGKDDARPDCRADKDAGLKAGATTPKKSRSFAALRMTGSRLNVWSTGKESRRRILGPDTFTMACESLA